MTNLFGEDFAVDYSKKKSTPKATTKQKANTTIENSEAGLFEGYEINLNKPSPKDLIKKINLAEETDIDADKLLKSKKISLEDRLFLIKDRVLKVLGKQKKNITVIKSKQELDIYIDAAIKSGRIAIDTETNNSLDPVTCTLMGPCFYYPGGKQAYVPLNHRNPQTKERLDWQLTEYDIAEALQKIIDTKTYIVMHNGKFDYEVLKCTCGKAVKPDWDTMVAARLLNENEHASLKEQYIKKIDRSQAKYNIDKLFEGVAYADVDPDIFALYAATDSLMTDKLYEIQKEELDKPEYGPHLDLLGTHEIKGLRWLFHEVEMPIVVVTAEMELRGVAIDTELGKRLQTKYYAQLEHADNEINKLLVMAKPFIDEWKLTKEAMEPTKTFVAKKTKMSAEKIEAQFPCIDPVTGNRYKIGKCKKDQIEDPINLASPTQLAILFYDILGVELDKKESRKTGKDDMKRIKEKLAQFLPRLEELLTEFDDEDLEEDVEEAIEIPVSEKAAVKLGMAAKLSDMILTRRGIAKLVTTYVDVIPELVKHWPDGRIRFHLNSLGTDTGRYSSGGKLKFMENDMPVEVSGINIQNIPSHNPEIRMLFTAKTSAKLIEANEDNRFLLDEISEVETPTGWAYGQVLATGDFILVDGMPTAIKSIIYLANLKQYSIEV